MIISLLPGGREEKKMIEIKKDELRVDETVLKYATDEEMKKLRDISKAICRRIQKGGAANE